MDEIEVRLDGKAMRVAKGSRLLDIVKGTEQDPVAGARVEGMNMSLRETVQMDATIESIHLSEKDGRRIYRKTLCFLLSYASSVIAPERVLILGHSLGDGFYFSYKDGGKPDTERLREVMEKAVADDLPVEIVTLASDEALSYARARKLEETERLLETRNDPVYRFAVLSGCMEVYYEPLLPSCSLLTIWELREYEDGLLLRYPLGADPGRIASPFRDNKKLFSVFCREKQSARILGVSCLGDLNRKVAEGSIEETIRLSEYLARRKVSDIAKEIAGRGQVKAVFISGPSSSGKTTFSMKLSDELRVLGLNPVKLSLDDYYLNGKDIPLDENGEQDFEVLESLDLPLFQSQMDALVNGEEVYPPVHYFKEQLTVLGDKPLRLKESDVLVIEGLHGLNPALCPDFPKEKAFRVYISALTQVNLDTRSRISTTDNRILRRLVRDNRTRGISATETLSRWPSVERGEQKNIFPYQGMADVMINSSMEYELAVLSAHAIPLLRSVRKESGSAYTLARRLLEFLSLINPVPDTMVPPDSIIREFIGGSVYHAL